MESERWQEIKELYLAASEREPSEWTPFLTEACGEDRALRDEVESLLVYEKDSAEPIESPPLQVAAQLLAHYETQLNEPDSNAMIGRMITHYRIVRKVGEGGMGVVYQAEDIKLGRFVALKFLSGAAPNFHVADEIRTEGSIYDSQALERLEREARASSTLDHPNICTVHEISEYEGCPFIAMQLLQGRTLKREIGSTALPVERIVDLGIQIADGLDAAHNAGIIHRDIKSANIFVTHRGEAKILDFGLAKLSSPGPTQLHKSEMGGSGKPILHNSSDTRCGACTAAGTIAYMSPEQVLGEELDVRTDLFSFGVVLYEMATGVLPFKGETAAAILGGILEEMPTSPEALTPRLPADLYRLINKALNKDRKARYQTAEELRDDLKRLRTESAARAVHANRIRKSWTPTLAVGTVLLVVALVASYFYFRGRQPSVLAESNTLLLADFDNTTGETVFDGTLKQALRVQLEQSPFLNVISDQKVRQALSFMGRPRDTKLTVDVAREVCLRTGSKALVGGAISGLGSHYAILLQTVNCQTGEAVGNEEVEAVSRDRVLQAMAEASTKLRARLGESLATIQKYSTPVEATTVSLNALQAYSLAMEVKDVQGENRAIPFLKRATELDPNFAMAYARLGTAYFNFNQPHLGSAPITRAYELRERVSEKERLYIEAHYYDMVTGEAEKSVEIYQLWQKIYPRDLIPYVNLTSIYSNLGRYEECLREGVEALRLSPSGARSYGNLSNIYLNLNQFDKAAEILNEAKAHRVENALFFGLHYQVAFMQGNQEQMQRQVVAAAREPGIESWLLALQGDTEAYHGRLAKARDYTRQAMASARHDGDEETALSYAVVGALREAEFGNRHLAREQVGAALAHAPGQQVLFLGALALARAGEHGQALALVRDLTQRFPNDTLLNEYWVPSIRAAVELDRGGAYQAIKYLEQTRRYELAAPQLPTNVLLYPIYLRGAAYLRAGLPQEAQVEFQKILNHPGLAGNYLLGALAHLAVGRAYDMEAAIPVVSVSRKQAADQHPGRTLEQHEAMARAHSAYQDFFGLWKDADSNISILKQAKAEHAKLH